MTEITGTQLPQGPVAPEPAETLSECERTVEGSGVPSYEVGVVAKLRVEVGRLRQTLAGREVTLRMHEGEHTRLVNMLQVMREYAGELLERARTAEAKLVDPAEYVIWSNEHGMWWRANSCGYTRTLADAGRYTRDEALSIAHRARDGWREGEPPPEIAVRLDDCPEPKPVLHLVHD